MDRCKKTADKGEGGVLTVFYGWSLTYGFDQKSWKSFYRTNEVSNSCKSYKTTVLSLSKKIVTLEPCIFYN